MNFSRFRDACVEELWITFACAVMLTPGTKEKNNPQETELSLGAKSYAQLRFAVPVCHPTA